uniref:Titin n=1 Tax=Macrostomum lignano TaxID=282301 RepID=A0A1I8HAJ4_9PLAT
DDGDSSVGIRRASLTRPGEPPRFVKHPKPVLKRGRGPLGSRFNTTFERGFVLLHITHTYPDDSGEYSCVAKSNFGMDQSNPVTLTVVPDEGVVTRTQLPEASMAANIDRLNERLNSRSVRQDFDDQVPQAVPQFVRHLESIVAQENGRVRFETRVTPAADPNVQIEWFKNGFPLTLGSRLKAVYDRGYTALEINCCYPEDNGFYHCEAANKHGKAQSNQAELRCSASAGVVTASALPESSVMNIQRLEEYSLQQEFDPLEAESRNQLPEPPRFLSDPSPAQLQLIEGSPAAFEARLDPGNGSRVQVAWFKDGQPVQFGSRVTASFEMGVAQLRFGHANAEDSGDYCAVALSENGQHQSGYCRLVCYAQGGVVTTSQLPGDAEQSMRSLMLLEEELERRTDDSSAAFLAMQQQQQPPPRIVRGVKPPPQIREGGQVLLDLQVEPSSDSDLSVEWIKDGASVACAARVRFELEKGRALLHISHCKPEDSGLYWAVVSNRGGVAESNRVGLVCRAGEGVVTRTQLPGEAQGYKRLEELERQWRETPIAPDEFRFRESEEPQSAPYFDILPESCTVGEGDPVKVLVKLSGNPRPVVTWCLDNQPIATSGDETQNNLETSNTANYVVHKDGSINCLEIVRCQDVGQHQLRVLAANPLGQVFAEAVVSVANFSRLAELRKVAISQELQQKISRPMGAADNLRKVERESEIKSLTYRDPEVEQAERLYASVQSRLRGGLYAGCQEGRQLPVHKPNAEATVKDLNPAWPKTPAQTNAQQLPKATVPQTRLPQQQQV